MAERSHQPEREQREERTKAAVSTFATQAPKGKADDPAATIALVEQAIGVVMRDAQAATKVKLDRNGAVAKLRKEVVKQVQAQTGEGALGADWSAKIDRALQDVTLMDDLAAVGPKDASATQLRKLRDLMGTAEGRALLANRPALAGSALTCVDAAMLKKIDLDAAFGENTQAVLEQALVTIGEWNANQKRQTQKGQAPDPAIFGELAKATKAETWNDPDKGIGPKVFMELWRAGEYDQICALVKQGVDTNLASRARGVQGGGVGVHSGFIQPLQHYLSPLLRDIALLDDPAQPLDKDPARKAQAAGAKKVWAAVNKEKAAVTLTSWKEVKESELVAEFADKPGTIWGFEHVRQPFVQAAHETDEGLRPLRMLELWDVVEPLVQELEDFPELLDDPDKKIKALVDAGVQKAQDKLASDDPSQRFFPA